MQRVPVVPSHAVGWGVSDAVLVVAGAHLLAIVWGGALLASGVLDSGDAPLTIVGLVLGNIGLWLGYWVGPVVVARSKGQGPVDDYGASARFADVPLGVVVGVVAQLALLPLLYLPIGWFVDRDPSAPARELIGRIDGPIDTVLLVASAAVLAPLFEELMYRGLLLRALQRRLGTTPAITISSLVFAAVHLDLLLVPGLFVFAVLASLLTVRTGRLGPAWAMHVAFNTTALIAEGLF